MKRIIKLKESQLTEIIKKVIEEQIYVNSSGVGGSWGDGSNKSTLTTNKPSFNGSGAGGSWSNETIVLPCAKLGVKYNGLCEKQSKKPVMPCTKLGIKSPGLCFVDTKKPINIK